MSDRIAIFDKGRIAQIGTVSEVYDRPASQFVSQFIGETNLLAGTVAGRSGGDLSILLGEGISVTAAPPVAPPADATAVVVSIRPERLALGESAGLHQNRLTATGDDVVYQGDHLRLHLSCGALKLVARSERAVAAPVVGSTTAVGFAAADCSVFPG